MNSLRAEPPSPGLPAPDAAALEHSRRLVDRIRATIRAGGGSISFSRYMEMALYEPGLGYYSAGSRKIGPDGDFVTAPELSPLFSRCVARQCAEVLGSLDGGAILELGAGSGAMAADILRELSEIDRLPDSYSILETSADLRDRQEQLIRLGAPGPAERVHWLDALPARPLRGIILANEVLDALPVHRVESRGGEVLELRVAWTDGGFRWQPTAAPPELKAAVRERLPDGYRTEINLHLGPWLAGLSACLEAGVILLLDYGYTRQEYFHPQRADGTLLCHYRHRVHSDPFLYPGLQDISAAVDFSAVAEAGAAAGLELRGFTTQAHFLLGSGLAEFVECASERPERERVELARQARILTLPGEMGEQVKVLALGRGPDMPLRGFAVADHRHRLA